MKKPEVSIILRSFNEERWIGACLESIQKQTYQDYEIILVDNKSTDKTLEKAKKYPVKILSIDNFLPGKALNLGIQESQGKYFICLSAHCIPTNIYWLENFVKNFEKGDNKLAAVYGRQEPMSFTSPTDKRDLLTIFGLDRKIQYKDSFFHNANSFIRRDLWNQIPFDENVTNIEDRVWAREIQKNGYHIVYDPNPSVYHWHGIHQNQNEERCQNVVRIIENLNREDGVAFNSITPSDLNIIALIPVKGEVLYLNDRPLLEYTISAAKKSKYIKEVYVLTDSTEHAEIATRCGAVIPFLRDSELSSDYVDLSQVYQASLEKMEQQGIMADVIVTLENNFPLRQDHIIDEMIERFVREGLDTLVPARQEFSPTWKRDKGELTAVDQSIAPRKFKEPLMVAVKGIASVTLPSILREGQFFGRNVGVFEINDPKSFIEVRDRIGLEIAAKLLQ